MKEVLSKQIYSLREPYGRKNVDLKRLAVLCGTCNDKRLLNDTTGNRRIIPVHVYEIDIEAYNKIDKTELFMAAYHLYKSGFKWHLTSSDIAILNENTHDFENHSAEYELILETYKVPESCDINIEQLTCTQIFTELTKVSGIKTLSRNRIGQELKRLGFVQSSKRVGKGIHRLYSVVRLQLLRSVTVN